MGLSLTRYVHLHYDNLAQQKSNSIQPHPLPSLYPVPSKVHTHTQHHKYEVAHHTTHYTVPTLELHIEAPIEPPPITHVQTPSMTHPTSHVSRSTHSIHHQHHNINHTTSNTHTHTNTNTMTGQENNNGDVNIHNNHNSNNSIDFPVSTPFLVPLAVSSPHSTDIPLPNSPLSTNIDTNVLSPISQNSIQHMDNQQITNSTDTVNVIAPIRKHHLPNLIIEHDNCENNTNDPEQFQLLSEDERRELLLHPPVDDERDDGYYTVEEKKLYEQPRLKATPASINDHIKLHWKQGELLGIGAYGYVYLGLNIQNGQLMAVKQVPIMKDEHRSKMSDLAIQTLQLEIEVMKNLKHENIVSRIVYIYIYITVTTISFLSLL